MGGGAAVNVMSFEEGWHIIEKEAIAKLIQNLELGKPCLKLFTPQEYMRFYTITYNMVCYNDQGKIKLYEQYRKILEDYISSKVLPCLRSCYENGNLLKEFLRRWSNHKTMIRWLSKFFLCIHIQQAGLPLILESINLAFYGRAYAETKDQIIGAIATLVEKEREGEEIDRAAVKQVLDIIEEIGDDALENYGRRIKVVIPLHAPKTAEAAIAPYEIMMERIESEIARISQVSTNNEKLLKGYRGIGDRVCEAFAPLIEEGRGGDVQFYKTEATIGAIFEECRSDALRIFGKDIEEALIEGTSQFYSKKAVEWMATMSYEDYSRKVEECLEKEKGRVSEYLRITKEEEILKIVQHELLNVHADELEAMKITSKIKTL